MNPYHHTAPPYTARSYTEVPPNAFYGIHVNTSLPSTNVGPGPGINGSGPSRISVHPRANSSPTSFYPSHLAQISQISPPAPPNRPSLGGVPPVPHSLMPGGGARIQRVTGSTSLESSLLFQSPNPLISPSISPIAPVIRHPYSQLASTSTNNKPALPPKPQLQAFSSGVVSFIERVTPPKLPPKDFTIYSVPQSAALVAEDPVSPDKDELVARVLELSLRDSGPVEHEEKEDEILARVLAESMASLREVNKQELSFTGKRSSSPDGFESGTSKEPLSASSSSASILSSFSGARSDNTETQTPATSVCSHPDDSNNSGNRCATVTEPVDMEELNRKEMGRLMREDEERLRQLEADEEFARSIARSEASNVSTTQFQTCGPATSMSPMPPVYDEVVREDRSTALRAYVPQNQRTLPDPSSSPNRTVFPSTPGGHSPLGRSSASYSAGSGHTQSSPADKLGRSSSAQASTPVTNMYMGSSSSRPSPATHHTPPATSISTQLLSNTSDGSPSTPKARPKLALEVSGQHLESDSGFSKSSDVNNHLLVSNESDNQLSPISPSSAVDHERGSLVTTDGPSSAPLVEEELLHGVSMGFSSPSMAQSLEPMKSPIPNIIALPIGRCLPLHIQAPSWKHLLKLLTRLSESRIEPTVEALAGTKSDIKLRTVIQFMRVHQTSNSWRTIIYLTIDVPVPSTTPNSHKYTNGDVNTFPYSYTISPIPPLLRAGAGDSSLSKCFTVPTTPNIPYPTLPLSLPDFAMYLHAVIENSRRASNDSSGGLRKLAKMVDSIYPNTSNVAEGLGPEFAGPDRRSVGGFFRRALGRGDRSNRNQGGGNLDTFEFITPFRIDEYR